MPCGSSFANLHQLPLITSVVAFYLNAFAIVMTRMRFDFDKMLHHHSNGDVNGLTFSSLFHLCYYLMAEELCPGVSAPPLGLILHIGKANGHLFRG